MPQVVSNSSELVRLQLTIYIAKTCEKHCSIGQSHLYEFYNKCIYNIVKLLWKVKFQWKLQQNVNIITTEII